MNCYHFTTETNFFLNFFQPEKNLTFVQFCSRLQFGNWSEKSCRVSRWLGSTVALSTQNQFVFLTMDRFLAAKNFTKYSQWCLRNRRLPLKITFANYVVNLLFTSHFLFVITYDADQNLCTIAESVDPLFQLLVVWSNAVVFFTLAPLLLIISLNIYIVLKLK